MQEKRENRLKIAVNAMRNPEEYRLLKEVGYDAVDYNGLCTERDPGCLRYRKQHSKNLRET